MWTRPLFSTYLPPSDILSITKTCKPKSCIILFITFMRRSNLSRRRSLMSLHFCQSYSMHLCGKRGAHGCQLVINDPKSRKEQKSMQVATEVLNFIGRLVMNCVPICSICQDSGLRTRYRSGKLRKANWDGGGPRLLLLKGTHQPRVWYIIN